MDISTERVVKAARLLAGEGNREVPGAWDFSDLRGQLIELSEEVPFGALTFTSELIAAAQLLGEPVGWISSRPSIFYPPDLAENGIDVSAVTVVSVADEREAVWVCDLLIRSGAFGFVIVDLEQGKRLSDAAMARLVHLCRRQRTTLLFLTIKRGGLASLSSLVTLRGVVRRRGPLPEGSARRPSFVCEITTVKDKRRTPGRKVTRIYDGPVGVC